MLAAFGGALAVRPQDPSPRVVWVRLKAGLSGPDSGKFFEEGVKDAMLPPFEGTLISSAPTDHPREFLVAVSDDKTPEVTLRLNGRLEKPLPAGTPVRFECIARGFTSEPFMLICTVESVNRATVPERSNEKKKSK